MRDAKHPTAKRATANHPTETQLALFAGKDLGFWEQRRVRSHVSQCARCRAEVRAVEESCSELRPLAGELPADLNWTRLSQEMTGNIRVGLAAGECIADFERGSRRSARPRFAWRTAGMAVGATAVVVTALWLNMPSLQMDHLKSALGQVRWERIGMAVRQAPVMAADAVVLEASPAAIEVKTGNQTLSLMNPRSDGATVSVNMQDSAGVRYIDADTGQVTINKVYYAQ